MPVLSPSDLPSHPSSASVEVGARVVGREGDRWILADALGRTEVVLDAPLSVGDHVVVGAALEGGQLVGATLLARYPACPPDGHDWRRFAHGGAHLLRGRQAVVAAIRSFFAERSYLEVETPLLVPSPGLDLHLDAFSLDPAQRTASRAHLITSPEYQMKRLVAGGLPRVFQLGRCFRRDEAGRRHLPEFSMLEWYRAYASMDDLIDETEALVTAVWQRFSPERAPLLDVPCHVERPFLRMTVAEAFERFADLDRNASRRLLAEDEAAWFLALVDAVEPGLARLGRPVFLTHYPAPLASLARLSPDDPNVAERFELYVGDVELCNGFGELVDPVEQRRRLEADQRSRQEAGKPVYPVDHAFVSALESGMPPTAGNALGLDRFIALVLGARRIDEVVAFGRGLLHPSDEP